MKNKTTLREIDDCAARIHNLALSHKALPSDRYRKEQKETLARLHKAVCAHAQEVAAEAVEEFAQKVKKSLAPIKHREVNHQTHESKDYPLGPFLTSHVDQALKQFKEQDR